MQKMSLEPDTKLCFTIMGPLDIEGQKAFYVQCNSEQERIKWKECILKVLEDFGRKQKQ